jgi:AbrB family looped-hinge helix DNA binding protein
MARMHPCAACIDYRNLQKIGLPKRKTEQRSFQNMKATGIVRRIDDLGRVVIPKEIRRTMRIREGDPSQITLARWERFCAAMDDLAKRNGWE